MGRAHRLKEPMGFIDSESVYLVGRAHRVEEPMGFIDCESVYLVGRARSGRSPWCSGIGPSEPLSSRRYWSNTRPHLDSCSRCLANLGKPRAGMGWSWIVGERVILDTWLHLWQSGREYLFRDSCLNLNQQYINHIWGGAYTFINRDMCVEK